MEIRLEMLFRFFVTLIANPRTLANSRVRGNVNSSGQIPWPPHLSMLSLRIPMKSQWCSQVYDTQTVTFRWTHPLLKFLPSEDRLIRESGIDGYAQCIAVDEQPPTRLRSEGKSEVEDDRKNELLRRRCDGHHVGGRVR